MSLPGPGASSISPNASLACSNLRASFCGRRLTDPAVRPGWGLERFGRAVAWDSSPNPARTQSTRVERMRVASTVNSRENEKRKSNRAHRGDFKCPGTDCEVRERGLRSSDAPALLRLRWEGAHSPARDAVTRHSAAREGPNLRGSGATDRKSVTSDLGKPELPFGGSRVVAPSARCAARVRQGRGAGPRPGARSPGPASPRGPPPSPRWPPARRGRS